MVFARAGHPVALYDSDAEALARNLGVIDASLDDLALHNLIEAARAETVTGDAALRYRSAKLAALR